MCARLDARLDARVADPASGFTDSSIDGLVEAAAESPVGIRLLFQHALREPEFSERIEKFRADIAAAAPADRGAGTGRGAGAVGGAAGTGLLLVIFALARTGRAATVPAAVGAYIGAAYWFTSSTSFANPAITSAGCSPTASPGSPRRPSPCSSPRRSAAGSPG
jgi:hypothetical protein